jgi:hypothetical protein
MSKIRHILRSLATLANTCASGHKSVIMLTNGRQRCMDCGAEW